MRSTALDQLVRRARRERAGFRPIWDQGEALRGREQAWLARDLAKIQPVTVTDSAGNRRRCESRFHLKRPDKQRIARAMLADGESDLAVRTWAGISQATVRRLKRGIESTETPKQGAIDGLSKRSKAPTLSGQVHRSVSTQNRPERPAYLDASSGANAEAESRFFELVGDEERAHE